MERGEKSRKLKKSNKNNWKFSSSRSIYIKIKIFENNFLTIKNFKFIQSLKFKNEAKLVDPDELAIEQPYNLAYLSAALFILFHWYANGRGKLRTADTEWKQDERRRRRRRRGSKTAERKLVADKIALVTGRSWELSFN